MFKYLLWVILETILLENSIHNTQKTVFIILCIIIICSNFFLFLRFWLLQELNSCHFTK